MVAENVTTLSFMVEELPSGAAYQFRVMSLLSDGSLSEPSEPSDILIIPDMEGEFQCKHFIELWTWMKKALFLVKVEIFSRFLTWSKMQKLHT